MTDGELLLRIADTLKQDIGPAVGDEFAKTQAFMAAVVLQKLGQQLSLAQQHAAADADELDRLCTDLQAAAAGSTLPAPVDEAIVTFAGARTQAGLCALIETLYAQRPALGDGRFAQLLDRVRRVLRTAIDRRLEYAA